MSVPALVRRELTNAKVYFIPLGEVVDSVTLSITTWPDDVPTSNWTGYEFAEIEGVVEAKKIKEETRLLPKDGGGYWEESDPMVVGRSFMIKTAKTNSYIKKLQHGFTAVPAAASSAAPIAQNNIYIEGALRIVETNKDGTEIDRYNNWVRMRLPKTPETGAATKLWELECEVRPAALNSDTVAA